MAKPRHISTLTSHIYGPYPEYLILKDNYPRVRAPIPIAELQMYRNDKPVGLDDTESIGKPPPGSVVFFGVFEIPSLECLSEQGLKFLQEDLRKHDEKIHMAHSLSGLTLGALYGHRKGEGSRIKVRLQCQKTLSASFLTTNTDPEKLIMYSGLEDRNRRFWVQSLHVSTFHLSRNFFDRYRLRAVIEELIRTDPDKTSIGKRNIDWLVLRYFETIHSRDKDNRIISNPHLDFDISTEPRHLRHLPRAAIRGYFASQAEWLLAHQLASSSKNVKMLDIIQWIGFCREARKDSVEAKKNGVRWGLPHGKDPDLTGPHNLARNLAKFGFDETFWANQLKIVHKKQEKSKTRKARSSPEMEQFEDTTLTDGHMQYDSDFSEPSTPEETDSEPDVPSLPISRIPSFCFQSPQLPSGRFIWHCPGCHYQIDLLDLSPADLTMVPADINVKGLRSKNWNMNEAGVRIALNSMVSHHYETVHLKGNGIVLEQSQGMKWRAVDIRPSTISPEQKTVKIEHSDGDLSTLRRSNRRPRPRRVAG